MPPAPWEAPGSPQAATPIARRATSSRRPTRGSSRSTLPVRLTDGSWSDRSPHRASQDDDRNQIGKHAKKLNRKLHARNLETAPNGVGKREQLRGAKGTEGIPFSEDHRGQRDEAAAAGHVRQEIADLLQAEIRPAQAGQRATRNQHPRDDGCEQAEPEAVRPQGHGKADEGAREHDALERDVDDARALAEDPAQGGEGQGGRRDQRLGQKTDHVLALKEIHHTTASSRSAICNSWSGSSRRRKSQRTITGAATKMMTIAWTTETRSAETWVSSCMKLAPLRSAPNRKAAGSTANGLLRASSATAMASKP